MMFVAMDAVRDAKSKHSWAVAYQRIMAAKQVANRLCQIPFVVSPSTSSPNEVSESARRTG